MTELDCARCDGTFPIEADHTEIVRRDYVGELQPLKVEYLCESCLHAYTEEFLEG